MERDHEAAAACAGLRFPSAQGVQRLAILHTVSSLNFGGMEQFVVRLAAAQVRRGHRVRILALRGGPLEATAEEAGVAVHSLGGRNAAVRFCRGMMYAHGFQPEVVHAHNATSMHYAAAAKVLSRARMIVTDHGIVMARRPAEWEVRRLDAAVAVSEHTRAAHMDLFGRAFYTVIPNGIEITTPERRRDEVRAALGLSAGLTGIVVARLDPLKDHATLLRAAAILARENIEINILIAGDGAERSRLEALAGELGLRSSHVRFLGFRTDVTDLLVASDFFALPSRSEGLPLSILEAMAQKLPVVATEVGGIPEVVEAGTHGFLLPPGDPEAFAGVLRLLSRDRDLCRRLGAAAYAHVRTNYTFDRMTNRYEDLYFALAGVKSAGDIER